MLATTFALLLGSSLLFCSDVYADTREELLKMREEKAKVMETIAAGNQTLSKYTRDMIEIQKEIDKLQEQVDKVEVLKKQAEDKEVVYQKQFNKRVRELYEKGETGYMALLLQSNSFGEFLSRFEMVRLIAQQDYALLKARQEATAQVQKQLDAYNKLIEEQNKKVEQSKAAYEKALKEIKGNEAQLKKIEEMMHDNEAELIEINRSLISSGKLKFAYTGPLQKPMSHPITSTFKMRWGRMHEGLDFGTQGKIGVPYKAAASGVVVESRVSSGYGWLITIYHGQYNGKPFYTRYAHSYPNQVKVKVGQEVEKGEVISAVGNNGRSTGPHLHFEVRIGSGAKPPASDPMKYFQ
jgi:murein DD-endopeptidase MepM/ murein hydrolase activator NlpD